MGGDSGSNAATRLADELQRDVWQLSQKVVSEDGRREGVTGLRTLVRRGALLGGGGSLTPVGAQALAANPAFVQSLVEVARPVYLS